MQREWNISERCLLVPARDGGIGHDRVLTSCVPGAGTAWG
ncbi:hypothetical protein HMPREF0058_0976 [Actinomyces urogenitalis DSM 15434]|uniref:Uncharacterized protein n=1 Tax=Actinomyces urogenitalis DSM 15434 TaxID=525246 RepID=C0W532_9ACTO|nr:hypothetical protein HMPREF0058_0976 [Actinomyces urogenitalis DSM 15434]